MLPLLKVLYTYIIYLNMKINSFKNKFLYYTSKKYFPRVVNKDKPISGGSIKTQNEAEQLTSKVRLSAMKDFADKDFAKEEEDNAADDETIYLHTKESIKRDPKFDEYHMARVNEKLEVIPEEMQRRAQRVFSKHTYKDIRFWTSKYLLNYCQNHACEPPIDLTNLPKDRPLFANSEEINIKIKLFQEKDKAREDVKKLNGEGKEDKDKGKQKDSSVKLDENTTIDIEEEKRLSKNKTVHNPIRIDYTQAHAVAYLYCRMPYSYITAKRVMREIVTRLPNFKPTSVLDYGSGLGSCAWAALDSFGEDLTKIAAVEPNKDMRRLGKFLTANLNKEIVWAESLTMIPGTGVERGKFDIVILSHVLQEVSTAKLRQMIIDTLWNRLNDDGCFIIIEPGSPKGYRFIYDLRTWVINKSRDEANIVAPCPHHYECPLASQNKDWCHFSQLSYKWDKTVVPRHKENLIYNDKFCYMIIKKGKTPSVIYKDESEAKTAEEKSFFWERLIRPAIRSQRHTILDLCTKEGRSERRIISKSHKTIGGYKTSKKVNWGDLWYIPYWLPNKFRKEGKKGKRLW
jgi:ribosomal protein RSM22 (predicted rRNA methylase)